ncbi:hypothetical protein PIB30_013528 [Stylosanthes scabra]|uniref:Uncharacterized protein n=1 Tax=Stylosanthes scabra TaxID=79078 RepID=A0ABU6R6W8_9FABA|nr:hypothetical protein [Stylosanthes scabra]
MRVSCVCLEMVVVNTIHPPLPAVITFTPELRLTHCLRLREALSILFDSIPPLRVVGWELACLDTQWREENRDGGYVSLAPKFMIYVSRSDKGVLWGDDPTYDNNGFSGAVWQRKPIPRRQYYENGNETPIYDYE